MSRLGTFKLRRQLVSMLGMIGPCLLIGFCLFLWFGGPLVAVGNSYVLEGIMARLIAVFLLCFLWLYGDFNRRLLRFLLRLFGFLSRPLVWSFYVTVIVLNVMVLIGWSVSYKRNLAYIEQVEYKLAEYQVLATEGFSERPEFLELLPRLNALRDLSEMNVQFKEEGRPLFMSMGLDQGDKIGAAINNAYFRELNNLFIAAIILCMEQQLRKTREPSELTYETLKVYLMMHDKMHYDPIPIGSHMEKIWAPYPADARKALKKHLQYLLSGNMDSPFPLNTSLVNAVRARLDTISVPERVYGWLQFQQGTKATAPFRISEAAGSDGEMVFMRASGVPLDQAMPTIFTQRRFFENIQSKAPFLVRKALNEDWVLDAKDESAPTQERFNAILDAVLSLYVAEYTRFWHEMLSDLRVVRFHSVGHALEVLDALSRPTSPMRKLLEALWYHTDLDRSGKTVLQAETRNRNWAEMVSQEFEPLNNLTRPDGADSPSIEHLIDMLAQLSQALQIAADGRNGLALEVLSRLESEAKRQPPPIKTWLWEIAQGARAVLSSDAGE